MNSSSASGAVPANTASGAEEGGVMKSIGSFFGMGGGRRKRGSRRGGKRRGGSRTRRNRRGTRRGSRRNMRR